MKPEIEHLEIDSLIPYARNSRTHSDAQVAQIAASIKEFGFTNPVLIDEDGGIIAGHGRVMAARKLKLAEVPCIRLSHLTDTQKRAYVIADNKLALNAGWDNEMLQVEFADLKDLDFDLSLTGFTSDEINELSTHDDENDLLDADKYTAKIEAPIYEIKGQLPKIEDLYSTEKTGSLTSKIHNTDMPDDVRGFLMAAATRHTVFNYENIAEFYAHQDEEIKRLMEDSALVIIDWDSAVENGYIKLTKALMNLSGESDDGQ
jgi:hypothetical protein